MAEPVRLAFSGRTSFEQLDVPFDLQEDALSFLQRRSSEVSAEIAQRLTHVTGVTPTAEIIFEEGSIEWHGFVQWTAALASDRSHGRYRRGRPAD